MLARGAAVFAALALCVGPLLTSWHEATTVHAVCAVHPGEIVHVQASPGATHSESPAVAGLAQDASDDEHERCAFDATRAPLVASRVAGAARRVTDGPSTRTVPSEGVPFGWPLYRLAPKSSPPA